MARDSLNPAAFGALMRGDIYNAHIAATPGGIERQEKAGQTALVNSTNVPIAMSPNREAFEAIGFVFGEPADDLFVSATLPAGWTRAATDHSMHSDILDDKGRKRVSIFYKAAFYDRRADCYLIRRFTVQTLYGDLPGGDGLAEDQKQAVVCDAGVPIFRTEPTGRRDYEAGDEKTKEADLWLAAQYADAGDPTAYWD